jgi:branched-subunit amino acid ABC-type transport system permease component
LTAVIVSVNNEMGGSLDPPVDMGEWDWNVIGFSVTHYTRFGRTVDAIGRIEPSAMLMGLPVPRVKVCVYVVSGFRAAVGPISSIIRFSGTLNSGWTRIASGLLIFGLIVM